LDRAGPRLLVLILAAGLIAAANVSETPQAFPIRAAQWLAPAGRLEGLSEQPPECTTPPASQADRVLFETGRTAFRTPTLLGGQAARAGLSCESCHSNGRRNTAFLFPGLSGAAGTADVTSSLMSSHRGNAIFDPRPIPDLAFPGKISRDPRDKALEHFVRGLIVEEFDGAEPPPRILEALAVYIRSIDAGWCASDDADPIRPGSAVSDVRMAAQSAAAALEAGDAPSGHLLLSGARAMLGRIDERFARADLSGERALLAQADRALLDIQHGIDQRAPGTEARLSAWIVALPGWSRTLLKAEKRSLYDPRQLAKALQQSAVQLGGIESRRSIQQ
jgi:hypothetical protein